MSEKKITISVLVLAQNSATTLKKTLDSIVGFDEVLVVDGGSQDDTRAIIEKSGAVYFENDFQGFSEQRNYLISKAQSDWILFVDSDESVTSELKEELYRIVQNDQDKLMYRIFRTEYIAGKEITHGHHGSTYQDRLFKRRHVSYHGKVHELPLIDGNVVHAKMDIVGHVDRDFRLLHNPNYYLEDILVRLPKYSRLMAKEKYEQGRRTSAFGIFGAFVGTFFQILYKNYRCGWRAVVIAWGEALYRGLVKLHMYQWQNCDRENGVKNVERS